MNKKVSQRTVVYCEGVENIIVPKSGDLGYDIKAASILNEDERSITYGTGVKFEPKDQNIHTLVLPRSSIRNYDLILTNSPALIDNSYRGEIQLTFRKLPYMQYGLWVCKKYEVGEKIAQLVFLKELSIMIVPKTIENNTERGDNGFGSTGR